MLAPGDDIETCLGAMNLRQIIPTDMTASALAHLSLLALVFLFSDVHPFGAVTAEPIAVDIVAPQDIAEQARRKKPSPRRRPNSSDTAAAATFARQDQRRRARLRRGQTARRRSRRSRPRCRQHALPRSHSRQPAPAATAGALRQRRPTRRPSLISPSNISVLLGLPPDLVALAPSAVRRQEAATISTRPATKAADVASSVVAEFRRHLRTCSKLPAALTAADDVKVKLRVLMTPQGKLAAEPILIEASASAKGPLLMQSAISALQACQPYAHAAGRPLRRMEGARSQLHAAGFRRRVLMFVMPGLVPGIHGLRFCSKRSRGWPGQARP